MGISCQRNSGYKYEQVKYHGTRPLRFPPSFPSLALIHTSLSWVGADQVAGKRAGGVHYEKKKRSRSIYTSHTSSAKPDGVTLHYTCPTPESLHWASPRGRPQHLYVKTVCATLEKSKKRKRPSCATVVSSKPFLHETGKLRCL